MDRAYLESRTLFPPGIRSPFEQSTLPLPFNPLSGSGDHEDENREEKSTRGS